MAQKSTAWILFLAAIASPWALLAQDQLKQPLCVGAECASGGCPGALKRELAHLRASENPEEARRPAGRRLEGAASEVDEKVAQRKWLDAFVESKGLQVSDEAAEEISAVASRARMSGKTREQIESAISSCLKAR